MELYEANFLDNFSLDVDKGDQIVRVLDAAVIKLEGGSDFDLRALDESPSDDPKSRDSVFAVDSSSSTAPKPAEEAKVDQSGGDEPKTETEKTETADAERSDAPKADLVEESGDGELMEEGEDVSKEANDSVVSESNQSSAAGESGEPKPRPLHKTCSIFFRNIPPSITRQEVEDVSVIPLRCFSSDAACFLRRNAANFLDFCDWPSLSLRWIVVSIEEAGPLSSARSTFAKSVGPSTRSKYALPVALVLFP